MTAAPSVLLVGNFLSGASRSRSVAEELKPRLERRGWTVVSASSKRGRVARLADMLATTWRFREAYGVAHVDVFSGRSFLWAELVCAELDRLRKPFVLTLRGGSLPGFAKRWPGRVRRLLARARAVTSPSGYLREELARFRSDVEVLPNPVELRDYEFRLRANPTPNLLWLRSFHAIYNPALAPQVLARLTDFPAARLTMVGADKDGSRLATERVCAELGLSQRVEFVGVIAKESVPARLARADVFLNTTDVDNTPVTLLEAMASGLCLVSTNVGGIPYLVSHRREAMLVPQRDPGAMAEAVREVLLNPELAASLSRNGRRRAEESDWATVLPRWESLLAAACRA